MFLGGLLFQYLYSAMDLFFQLFQMWISLKINEIQVEINKLAEDEQQGQDDTFAIGFHAPNEYEEYNDYEDSFKNKL